MLFIWLNTNSKSHLITSQQHSLNFVCEVRVIYLWFVDFSSQIRSTLKKKAFEDAGLPVQQARQQVQVPMQQQTQQTGLISKSSEVTLNMLNAPDGEVDVEGLQEEVKLEFEPGAEEVHQ